MNILLLGANGQVGFELQRSLAPLGRVIAATRSGRLPGGAACETLDLADAAALQALLQRSAPQLIVNAAAHTAVDRAEDEESLAQLANATAPGLLGQWAAAQHCSVVHYSTDYIFDGQGLQPYREDDATGPVSAYGRSKLGGELALAASGAAYLNFRTAWVYAARGSNFLRTMLRLARERDRLSVVADQRGAPTPARLIANTTAAVLARWLQGNAASRQQSSGHYHLVSAGECSWQEFAVAIMAQAQAAGLIEKSPDIAAIATADYPTKARRPAYSVLDTGKLRQTFGLYLPDWREGLRDVIAELGV
ncbi:dTDP-4-dehydrorhamnose reductase [Tahibacter aquaticus]|uniref:dTDP-4-dehydrorhamnose reductase n=1 Tax=Tahibacter aquaticus TaxID=520092 RepID=A0A4R6Z933_9GAMM|nr:dTDP-4-dehydrorhamnose reductase [Tahibacter aquaticus]TDR48407.1 dTDP-4-dehydrorhamnose reductase [Tahibacter aquaticus]